MHSFSTADLLDEYPESIVLMENFLSYGEVSTFFGRACLLYTSDAADE